MTRKDPQEHARGNRAAAWRYWLGAAIALTLVWGVLNMLAGELGFYWPIYPLAVWGAILLASTAWGDARRAG